MNEIGPAPPGRGAEFSDPISARARVKPKGRRLRFISLMLFVVAGGVAVGFYWPWHRKPPTEIVPDTRTNSAAPLVTTGRVEQRPMNRTLSVDGSLVAWHEVPVGVEASGSRINDVLVDVGDSVVQGQVLARLDASTLQAQLHHAQAAAQAATAAATSAKAAFERVDGIRSTGAVSAEQVGQRRADAAEAAARQAEAQAEVSEIQARLDQLVVRAPVAGVIAARQAEPGAVVTSGGPPLFELIADGLVEFDAQIPQDELQQLTPGLPAEISLGGPNDAAEATISGHIRAIAPTVDPQTRLGVVHITLPRDPRLRPGSFVQGRIVLSRSAVLSVPLSAILWEGGQSFAYVVAGDRAQRRAIQAGTTQDGWVAIRGGLAGGEQIVLSAGAFLHDGEAVRQISADQNPHTEVGAR